jgi:hypothetical protein
MVKWYRFKSLVREVFILYIEAISTVKLYQKGKKNYDKAVSLHFDHILTRDRSLSIMLYGFGKLLVKRNMENCSVSFRKVGLVQRGLLKRKNFHLESYTCNFCICQGEETLTHLLLRYNFTKACWTSIYLPMSPPLDLDPLLS